MWCSNCVINWFNFIILQTSYKYFTWNKLFVQLYAPIFVQKSNFIMSTLKWVFTFWEIKSIHLSVGFFNPQHNFFFFPHQCDWLLNTPVVPLVSLTPPLVPDTTHIEGIKKIKPKLYSGLWKRICNNPSYR